MSRYIYSPDIYRRIAEDTAIISADPDFAILERDPFLSKYMSMLAADIDQAAAEGDSHLALRTNYYKRNGFPQQIRAFIIKRKFEVIDSTAGYPVINWGKIFDDAEEYVRQQKRAAQEVVLANTRYFFDKDEIHDDETSDL